MAYSMDLRQRAVDDVEQGDCVAVVARRFKIHSQTVHNWVSRHQQNQLESRKPGPKGPRKLTVVDDAMIIKMIEENPGVTAKEVMPMLSVSVVESTVCRAMKRLGFRLKKVADRRGAKSA